LVSHEGLVRIGGLIDDHGHAILTMVAVGLCAVDPYWFCVINSDSEHFGLLYVCLVANNHEHRLWLKFWEAEYEQRRKLLDYGTRFTHTFTTGNFNKARVESILKGNAWCVK
jgi:hypothetical protein